MPSLSPETPYDDPPPTGEDAALLLADYLDSGREEAAFARLVARTGGMVYGSALRRTGDTHLAEEVVQNVFTLLARKAASLRRHPSLAAWIFQTTRYEAAKAMRSEYRRRRKLDALAEELAQESISKPNPGDEAWREALPALYESLDHLPERDRALVLERFFEGRKFSEIAVKSGRSEAACKVGLKRALEKLSRFLTSRGVTLSATAVASALTAEFARSAPLQTLALVAPKALAASGGLTAATLITNTVQTMSTLKTATLTGAAVLAVATVPFFMQESEASKARGELADLAIRGTALEERVSVARRGLEGEGSALGSAGSLEQTIGALLAAAEEPLDIETLMNGLMEAMMTRDIVGMIRIFLPVANLDADEYNRLIDELKEYGGNAQMKMMAMQMLGSFAPSDNPKESLERMMALELEPYAYANLLDQWAAKNPDDAYAWYHEKLASGALAGKGVHNTPEEVLLGHLVAGMARNEPGRTLDFIETVEAEKRGRLLSNVSAAVAEKMIASGDEGLYLRLLDLADAHGDRLEVVAAGVTAQVRAGSLSEGRAFIEKYLDDPEQRHSAMVNMVTNQQSRPLAERADWLVANVSEEGQVGAVRDFVARVGWNDGAGVTKWLDGQSAGPIRDGGYASLSEHQEQRGSLREAYDSAQKISDADAREARVDQLATIWLAREPDAARETIPVEVLVRISEPK